MAAYSRVVSGDELLSLDEVSRYLKIRQASVARWVREGRLRPARWAGRLDLLRFRRAEVDQLFEPLEDSGALRSRASQEVPLSRAA